MSKRMNKKFTAFVALFATLMLLLFIGVGFFSYDSMQNSLYEERISNVSTLMGKSTQHVDREIEMQWNNIHHFRNMFEDSAADFQTLDEARGALKKMREIYSEQVLVLLFIVDENLNCYQSETASSYAWQETDQFQEMKDACIISYTEFHLGADEQAHMFFVSPLNEPIVLDGISFTRIGMAVDMSFMDDAFDTNDLGENSVAFIFRHDGTQLYSQSKNSPLSQEKNILTKLLEEGEFTQGETPEQMRAEIRDMKRGEDKQKSVGKTIYVRYNGEGYYVSYYLLDTGLSTRSAVALYMLPSYTVSTGTREFMGSIIGSTALIALAVIAIILFIIFTNNYRVRKQLLSAADAERDANQAKTRFLSAMSHDIRTPMNAIIGMTTLAGKRLDETEYVKSCLNKISLASSHLLTLINDILDITKVESGKMSLNPISFSLTDTVSNLINVIRPLVKEKLHDFEFRVHNMRIENVYADQLRINQIFINLLSNAVKYTPEGGKIVVDLKEEPLDDNPDVVRLTYTVQDNGVGMSEEFQKTMYRSFTREEQTELHRIQGSGLGLTICKQMVDLMGGKIECESQVGMGTTFTVTLDLLMADNDMEHMTFVPTEVLLVDDDPAFLLAATDTLLQLGLLPDCVESGEEAIRTVEERRKEDNDYPLIIVDWQMPNMNGLETIREIRRRVGEEVSIIVVSAYDIEEIQEQAQNAGINGFISKPFFRSTVYNALKGLLEEREGSKKEETHEDNPLRGLRILVAEDNELNWEIAKDILSMYGVITVRAENGQACLDIMENTEDGDYDLILMDIQMPLLNGYQTTQALRASEREYLRTIPIIAMTADAFSEDIQRCKEVGMNAHIAKPINVTVLLDTIESRVGNVKKG